MSYFLPFNQGKTSIYNLKNVESIIETGDGNENREDGKFPVCYMWEDISKRFAVIIDEAHSSTNGRNMEALVKSLNNVERVEGDSVDAMDIIENDLDQTGKAANVSMFAFTAPLSRQLCRSSEL